jgi:hypothetical protein
MKTLKYFFCLLPVLLSLSFSLQAQEFEFKNTTYYYKLPNDSLVSTGLNLGQFNFSFASRLTDSLFNDGIYFPASDCFGNNLWIRLRHISEDPNGNSTGKNVTATSSVPCLSNVMIGGWWGFLYDFEIHRDRALTGNRAYFLGELFPTSITVASLETLSATCSGSEWLSFSIKNDSSTGWRLNSINFTGSNTSSNPAYNEDLAVYSTGGCYPPDSFSYTFPTGAEAISFINASQFGYSEFKISAGNVSHFQYGYEFGDAGGYQGMSMAFGVAPTIQVSAIDVTCKDEKNGQISVEVSGGIGPYTYEWNNGTSSGSSLTGLPPGTYNLVVTDQNGCGSVDTTVSINEPEQSIDVSLTVTETKITANETDATYQWINCAGNVPIPDSTFSTFSPSEYGDYKVAITKNGCSDTSVCANVATIGIPDHTAESYFRVFPNPSTGALNVSFETIFPSIGVSIADVSGRIIVSENFSNQSSIGLNLNQSAGVYFLIVNFGTFSRVQKLFIQ